MGRDGLSGARRARRARRIEVLVQDRASSAVWGMPRAVAEAGLASACFRPPSSPADRAYRSEAASADERQRYPILAACSRRVPASSSTMSRRWRIETALQPLMRERGIATGSTSSSPPSSWASEPALVRSRGRGAAQQRDLLLPRPAELRPAPRRQALPRLERRGRSRSGSRIWCAGCSTGQEAYSLAMRFAEQNCAGPAGPIDILGTDVSRSCDRARAKRAYSQFEVQRGLAVNQMMRWFEETAGDGWQIAPELRRPSVSRSTACSSRRRIPAASTSFSAATSSSISQPRQEDAGVRAARSPPMAEDGADARRGRDGDRPDRASSAPIRRLPRPLPARRPADVGAVPRKPPPLDRGPPAAFSVRLMRAWRSSTAPRPISTSGCCRSRCSSSIIPACPTRRRARPPEGRRRPRSRPIISSPRTAQILPPRARGKARLARRPVVVAGDRPTSIRRASGSRSSIPATNSAIALSR
jgi:hypothetical protein